MKIEISNMHINLIESDLQRLFTPYGEIDEVMIIRDKINNRPTGRAMIEMPVDKEAIDAIAHLNGMVLLGKTITVGSAPYMPGQRNWY